MFYYFEIWLTFSLYAWNSLRNMLYVSRQGSNNEVSLASMVSFRTRVILEFLNTKLGEGIDDNHDRKH